MKRYTINIGDPFPLEDHGPEGRSRRAGFWLRALFGLAVAVIVLTHPFKAAILLGLALLFRRTGWVREMRGQVRHFLHEGVGRMRADWQRRQTAGAHGPGYGRCGDPRWNRGAGAKPAAEEPDPYKAFV